MPEDSHGIVFPNFVYISVAVASFSNFAAFYALGLITAALLYIPLSFPMDWVMTAAIVTGTLIGGMIGALAAGPIADRIGRRKSLLIGSALLLVGGVTFSVAPSVWFIIIGRFLSGLGVGVITNLANLLVVELAPAAKRGALSVIPYVFQFIGTMSPFLVGYLIVLSLPQDRLSLAWRLMAASGVVISALDLISLSIWLPESPRWLFYQQKTLEGLALMEKIYGPANHDLLIQDYRTIVQSCNEAAQKPVASWLEMFQKAKYRRPLLVGIFLQLLRKLSGNAAISFYLTLILVEAAGLSKSTALLISLLIYIPDFLVVFGVFRCVDRMGRKLMLLISCSGLAVVLLPMALALTLSESSNSSNSAEHQQFILNYLEGAQLEQSGQVPTHVTCIVILSLFLQRCFYSFGLGPIPSIHTAESLPHQIRARGLSLSLFFSWFAAAAATLFFPWSIIALPAGSAYWMFFGVAVLGIPFIWFGVRETTHEHIDTPICTPKPRPASVSIQELDLEDIPL